MKYEELDAAVIRAHVFQLLNPGGVYTTVAAGKSRLLVFDTGFGLGNLRQLMESCFSLPFVVVNSHGHPDHVMGNNEFECVYAPELEFSAVLYFNSAEYRVSCSDWMSRFCNIDDYNANCKNGVCDYKIYRPGDVFDLGNVHARAVPLYGHTFGSLGLLLEEDRILLAGDAIAPVLWMSTDESGTIEQLVKTLQYAKTLPFNTFLSGHCDRQIRKTFIDTILYNAEHLQLLETSRAIRLGVDTYESTYTDTNGTSKIIVKAM